MHTYISPKTKFTMRYWDMFSYPNQPYTWAELNDRRFLIRLKDQYINPKVMYNDLELFHPAHHYLVPTMDVELAIDLSYMVNITPIFHVYGQSDRVINTFLQDVIGPKVLSYFCNQEYRLPYGRCYDPDWVLLKGANKLTMDNTIRNMNKCKVFVENFRNNCQLDKLPLTMQRRVVPDCIMSIWKELNESEQRAKQCPEESVEA